MRKDINDGVLVPYSAPAMRVVPTDGGRIVAGSLAGQLGTFNDGDAYGWNSLGGNAGPSAFSGGDVFAGWNDGSASGALGAFDSDVFTGWNSLGGNAGPSVFSGGDVFTGWNSLGGNTGPSAFSGGDVFAGWNDGSASGALGLFTGGDDGQGWNSGGGSTAAFGDSDGTQMDWDEDNDR